MSQDKKFEYDFEKFLAPLRAAWDFIARLVRFVVKNATAIIQLDMIALIVPMPYSRSMHVHKTFVGLFPSETGLLLLKKLENTTT